jgi:hypothetical protein
LCFSALKIFLYKIFLIKKTVFSPENTVKTLGQKPKDILIFML